MGSSSQVPSMMEAAKDSSKPKKFSPFSVDSLLATKVRQQQSEHHQLDNNNTKSEKSPDHHHTSQASNAVDLSLKKEESIVEEDQGNFCKQTADAECHPVICIILFFRFRS